MTQEIVTDTLNRPMNYWDGNTLWPNDMFHPWQPVPTYVYPSSVYFQISTPRCAWCQGTHTGKCDRLKSVTYCKDGTVTKVEFFGDDDE